MPLLQAGIAQKHEPGPSHATHTDDAQTHERPNRTCFTRRGAQRCAERTGREGLGGRLPSARPVSFADASRLTSRPPGGRGGGAAGKCASLGGLLTSCPANGPATLWFFLFCYLPGLRPAARAPLRVFPSFRSPAPKLPRTRAAALRSAGASLSSRAGHAMLCVGPQGSRRGEAVRGRRARPASPLWLWRASRARTCKPLMLCNRRRAAYTQIMYISICII